MLYPRCDQMGRDLPIDGAGVSIGDRDDKLQFVSATDDMVEQAKGIVAEHHGIDTAIAFERIRQHARTTRSKVHDVARAVVDRDLRL